MGIPRRSRFTYDLAGVFETVYSARPWTPGDETIGGTRISDAGIPASYIARRDSTIDLPLRIQESEWADFLALIAFGQSAQQFLWFPDGDEVNSFLVYLHAPMPPTKLVPTRDGSYPRMFEVTITLRGVGAVVPWAEYFE